VYIIPIATGTRSGQSSNAIAHYDCIIALYNLRHNLLPCSPIQLLLLLVLGGPHIVTAILAARHLDILGVLGDVVGVCST